MKRRWIDSSRCESLATLILAWKQNIVKYCSHLKTSQSIIYGTSNFFTHHYLDTLSKTTWLKNKHQHYWMRCLAVWISMPSTSWYLRAAAAAAKSLQSCPTLCDPIDGSPSGFPIPGILQARTREWVAISFSNAWKWKVKVKSLSRVRPSAPPWTVAYQAPPSMGFSRQEYWSGVPLPSPYLRAGALNCATFGWWSCWGIIIQKMIFILSSVFKASLDGSSWKLFQWSIPETPSSNMILPQ